ncbi:MAG: tetratricopeptide repeat protein, partial [Bacteroidota bacterium]
MFNTLLSGFARWCRFILLIYLGIYLFSCSKNANTANTAHLTEITLSDSTQIDQINYLIDTQKFGKADSLLSLLEAKVNEEEAERGMLYFVRGDWCYYGERDLYQAIDHYRLAYQNWQRTLAPNHKMVAEACNYLAYTFHEVSDYDSALSYFHREAIIDSLRFQEAPQLYDARNLAENFSNLASTYGGAGNYELSLVYYEKAWEMIKSLGEPQSSKEHESNSLLQKNLGVGYYSIWEVPAAKYHINAALQSALKADSAYVLLINTYCNLANILVSEEKADSALKVVKTAQLLYQKVPNPPIELTYEYHKTYGNALRSAQQYDSALYYYREAINLVREIPDVQPKAYILGEVAWTFFQKKDYTSASDYFSQASYILAQKGLDYHPGQVTILNAWGKVEYEAGHYNKAKQLYQRAIEVNQPSPDNTFFEGLDSKEDFLFSPGSMLSSISGLASSHKKAFDKSKDATELDVAWQKYLQFQAYSLRLR